jgi:hypothetical protein
MNDDAARRTRRFAFLASIVIGIALILRLLHVFFTERFNPLAGDLQLDAATYDRWARALAFGGDSGPTTLMQAPVYPWFLSMIYRVAGPSLTAVRIVQAVIGTATVGLIMLCTRRCFKSAGASLLAGIFAALYFPFIFYEGVLVSATLIIFLNVLFVAVLFTDGRPGAARLLASGAVLGVTASANPPSLLLLPIGILHLSLMRRRADGATSPRKAEKNGKRRSPPLIAASALLLAGVVVGLAPVTIRNALRVRELIPLTTGGGINFYIGNNPGATGFYAVPSFEGKSLGATPEQQAEDMRTIASASSGRQLSANAVSRFWLDAGLDYIRQHPKAWGALLWEKFQFFWNRYERSNVENPTFHRRFPGVLRLPLLTFGVIAPLGLLGVFLTRSRWMRLALLYGGILTYLLTALAFYVLARYRIPAVPFLVAFAGAAVTELVELGRSRRIHELVLSVAALALLAFFSNMTVARDTPHGISGNLTRLGDSYIARRDTMNAEKAYREALELDEGNANARRSLMRIIPQSTNPTEPVR